MPVRFGGWATFRWTRCGCFRLKNPAGRYSVSSSSEWRAAGRSGERDGPSTPDCCRRLANALCPSFCSGLEQSPRILTGIIELV